MTHTERVHVIFGVAIALTGLFALRSVHQPESRARFVWPALVFLIGLCLFVPVEAQSRTYRQVGWWATLVSVVPQNLGSWLPDWLAMLRKPHVVQHKLGAALTMLAGLVELGRSAGRLRHPAWGRLLPLLAIGVGLAFAVHGGTSAHLPHAAEQRHHWLLGAAFVLGGAALAAAQAGLPGGRRWWYLWAALMTAAGLDLALFYRLH